MDANGPTIKRVLVRTPAGMAFMNPTGAAGNGAPRSLPPMRGGGPSSLQLPAQLTSSFTVTPLPDVGAVDQMGAPAGIPTLSLSSSFLSLSTSMPDLPPPRTAAASRALVRSRRSGASSSRASNRLNASL